MNRRAFLRQTGLAGLSALPFRALLERSDAAEQTRSREQRRPEREGYGPLVDTPDATTGLSLLRLPRGFRYLSMGWALDPLTDGRLTPRAHDGMGAFRADGDRVRLVRNHEVGRGAPFGPISYDSRAAGGTTTLEFDARRGELISAYPSLSGTVRNCAGGCTPWGSWLTCEETDDHTGLPHGYVFEVPAAGYGHPVPLRDMGRFSHEALAVDPSTGHIYETEDSDEFSGFYRFVPREYGNLTAGGSLFMLRVRDMPAANLGGSYPSGTSFHVDWVPIEQPDDPRPRGSRLSVWTQGRLQGAATFSKLEGCWHEQGKVYFVASRGGTGHGQIWEYTISTETLSLVFESPGPHVLNRPDNITASPRGGLVLCEDGSDEQYVQGLTLDGRVFRFAQNNVQLRGEKNGLTGDYRTSEFAGACYSPDGRWLFVNVQEPGITFAITGRWGAGAL